MLRNSSPSLFSQLPNRQDVGIIARRSPLASLVQRQVKVPAGIVAAVIAVAAVALVIR